MFWKKNYQSYLISPENGFDVTLQLDLSKPPQNKEEVAKSFSLLKRHCLSAPYYYVFNQIDQKKSGDVIEVPYRDEEAVYLKSETDRCLVVFSIQFKDPNDVIFARVFLNEYKEARKLISNAPAVTYSPKDPPLELKSVKNVRTGAGTGFVTFVLFPGNIAPTKRENTIDSIQTFRNYLHYHIKCSKAYMHTRMRTRVQSFLQVLNRSKQEQEKEKKTFGGKTFKRADDPPSTANEFNI